jgi:hypothetical protein
MPRNRRRGVHGSSLQSAPRPQYLQRRRSPLYPILQSVPNLLTLAGPLQADATRLCPRNLQFSVCSQQFAFTVVLEVALEVALVFVFALVFAFVA